MATYYFYGFAPDSFTFPEPGTMQLDPDWDVQDDAYDFHITDDDSTFQGDSVNGETGDDTDQQTGIVYDENGNIVANGQAYLEEAYVLTDGNGNTVRLYRVEIGGTHVGYIADGPIQPGNTYTLSTTENVNDGNAPQYTNLEDQSYNEDTSNTISGTTNDDTLTSDSGSDSIQAGDGDDSISSGTGADTVYGGAGNDTIDSAQQDGSGSVDGDFVDGGSGDDSITGSGGNDTILGGADNDTISGEGGDDSIDGGAGNDSISGGSGRDTIEGGDGLDTIDGGMGDDSIDGGAGDDILTGGDEGTADVSGSIGTGNYADAGNGYTVTAQNVSGGALTAPSTANVATNGGGLGATGAVSDTDSGQDNQLAFDKASGISEQLIVNFDNDVSSASFSFQSLFTSDFGEVGHWAIYNDGALVAESDFTEDTPSSGNGTVDLSGFGAFDQIVFTANLQTDGSDGSDYVVTDISYTMPVTETSDDTVAGGAGDDIIYGGTGADSLSGGIGSDTIEGGDGSDTIHGGSDSGTVVGDIGGTDTQGEDWPVIRLGNAADVDPDESDSVSENAASLLGSYGGAGSELYNEILNASGNDVDGDSNIDDNDSGNTPETITIGGVDKFVDSAQVYNATVTFTDGTTGTFTAVVFQTTDGDVYLAPEMNTGADNDLLTSKPIESVSLDSLSVDNTNLADNRVDANYKTESMVSDTDTSGDSLSGGGGTDLIYGGAGDDTIDGGDRTDTVYGGAGDDLITDSGGVWSDDTIYGEAGDDTISGGVREDYLDGGDDADTILIEDGFGNDTIVGGEGGTDYDTIDLSAVTVPVTVTFTGTGAGTITDGTDTITFSEIERLVLTESADVVDASNDAGGIEIVAAGGDDSVTGGTGADTIDGGAGDDTLDGGTTPVVAPTSERLDWTSEGVDEADLSAGFTQDTGVMNVTVSYQSEGGGTGLSVESSDKQYVQSGEPFDEFSAAEISGTGSGVMSTTRIDFNTNTGGYSDNVENVSFRLSDIDSGDAIDHVTINAYDADGNSVNVTLSQTSNGDDMITGNQVTGANGTDNPDNESGSVLVGIAGPVSRIEIIYGNDGTGSGSIGVSDIHFETVPGPGNDSLIGGAGDDVFLISNGDDTIADFNTGNTGTLNDGDSTNNDFIDLSAYYDNLSELYADQADDGVLNQSNAIDSKGRSVDYGDNTQFGGSSVRMQGASADSSSFTQENTGVVCFTSGTAIRTPQGDRLIDDLRVGDLVCTLDNGSQRIRWIGQRVLGPADLAASPNLRPILIKRGVLGAERDLLVSPQHGMLMPDQTLIRAKFLAEAKGNSVRIAHGQRSVRYIHLLFDQHQIIFAENTRSESLYPGKMAFNAMGSAAYREMSELFPDLDGTVLNAPENWYGVSARTYLRRREALQERGRIRL